MRDSSNSVKRPDGTAAVSADVGACHATLFKHVPATNQHRFYYVAVWPDLFGGFSLVREWGRIGQPGTLRLDPYPDASGAEAAFRRLLHRKRTRGYRLSS